MAKPRGEGAPNSALIEDALTENAPADDPLLGVLESIEGLDPLPLEAAPPPEAASVPGDGLDDLFDEIAALGPAQPVRAAPSADGLDSLLGEIAAVSAAPEPAPVEPSPPPPPSPPVLDDLDELLGEIAPQPQVATAPAQAAAPTQSPLDALLDDLNDDPSPPPEPAAPSPAEPEVLSFQDEAEPAPAPAKPRRKFKLALPALPRLPGGRRLALALGGMTALGLSHGLAFALGAWSVAAPHGEATAEPAEAHAAPPPAEHSEHPAPTEAEHGAAEEGEHTTSNLGPMRYVGLSGEARVEGRTIFSEKEVRSAIEQLEGGLTILAELDAAEPQLTFTAPISHNGDWIEVHACNRLDCGRDALALRLNMIEGQASLCRTRPYVGEARMFYAYGPAGMKEVPGCPS